MNSSLKRQGISNSNPDSIDSSFWNKRIMGGGSAFDVQRAQSPAAALPAFTVTPALDTHQAELSVQHVRALNAQFASWVQNQLMNHPDELWEDGVRDYLNNASSIMDKFSDVVNWIKANNSKGDNLSKSGFENAESGLMPSINGNIPNFLDKANSIATPPMSFSNSWSSVPSQNNQVSLGLVIPLRNRYPKLRAMRSKPIHLEEIPSLLLQQVPLVNSWSTKPFSYSPPSIFSGFQNTGSTKPYDSNDKDDGDWRGGARKAQ